jgi:putative flippase GtrA
MALNKRVLRFVVVGCANAAISFGILNLCFYSLHQNKIVSSIIGTTCALLFSFALNRTFVFSDKSRKVHQQFIPFAVVTISGSIAVLNLVYIIMLRILNGHEAQLQNLINDVTGLRFSKDFLQINLSTLVGSLVAMFWNYNGYKRFVFKGSQSSHHDEYKVTETTDEAS